MNFIITGGTGFIGTHLTNLIKEQDREALVWNLDIVDPNKLDQLNEKLGIRNEEWLREGKANEKCSSTKEIYKQIEEMWI